MEPCFTNVYILTTLSIKFLIMAENLRFLNRFDFYMIERSAVAEW